MKQNELKKRLAGSIAINIIENELNGIEIYEIEDNEKALQVKEDLKTIQSNLIKALLYSLLFESSVG